MKLPSRAETVAPIAPLPIRRRHPEPLILRLQQTAGNAAVNGLLAMPSRRAGNRLPAPASAARMQRDPILTAAVEAGATPGKVPVLTPEELIQINVEASIELRRLAGNAIGSAVEQFHRACDAVKADLEKAAKQRTELVGLVADILGGFAVPGLAGRLVAETALRKTLVDASRRARVGDLGAMTTEITTMAALRQRGAALHPQFADRISEDHLKATFNGAMKVMTTAIKNAGPGVLTGSKPKVIAELSHLATLGRQDLDRSLATKSESELLAIIVALDAGKANETTYQDTIRRYLDEVVPIGAAWMAQSGGGRTKLVRMDAYGGFRLAVVESGTAGMVVGTPYHDFKAWVSPGMQVAALAREGLSTEQAPLEVLLKQVPILDPGKISNSIPAPTAADSAILP
jgi:hypothetical protein